MKIYLFDSIIAHQNLLPLSFTRPLADFRCGILTIHEKWQHYLNGDFHFYPVEYLQQKFGSVTDSREDAIFIAGNLLPDKDVAKTIENLEVGEAFVKDMDAEPSLDNILAYRGSLESLNTGKVHKILFPQTPSHLEFVFDIFLKNGEEIKKDYKILTAGRKSGPLPECVKIIGPDAGMVFVEEGASVECASINTKEGPVYIGKNSSLMEGALIRGPFALCEEAEVRMGTKIYEATTIGPHCKAGGEISNAVFFGYSNKSHDGYLGNAVIGEWCNIGAGVNASNLKNDYSPIRIWNYHTKSFMRTNLQFCGLIMGDHSKIGVNCMINTATVIGVGVNIHGAGFPRNFVPCFCEGSPSTGFSVVPLKKFLETAKRVMSRRDLSPSEADISILQHIYENS